MTVSGDVAYSVVVPVFCESESLVELADRVAAVFSELGRDESFEIVFVDDGSTDETPTVIEMLCQRSDHIRAVTLRRNCGKSTALMMGFAYAVGDFVITMDGDLQDNPEDIPKLLEKLDEGYDLVSGWRHDRKDSRVRKLGSRLFNGVVGRYTRLRLHDFNCGFKVYRRRVATSLCLYSQYHRYTPLLAHRLGFKVAEVKIDNSERRYGISKYRTFRYQSIFDLLSIVFVYRYGTSPLHFFGILSAIFVIPSFSFLLYSAVRQVLWLLGFGDEFMLQLDPMLGLSLAALVLGAIVFLVGFMCDFILHHQFRANMGWLVALHVDRVTEQGSGGAETKHIVPSGLDPTGQAPPGSLADGMSRRSPDDRAAR